MAEHNEMQDKTNSRMYQHGKTLVEGKDANLYNNSHRYRNQQAKRPPEKPKAVAKGTIVPTKQDNISKFRDSFFASTITDSIAYAASEVFIPTLKNMVRDVMGSFIDQLIYGSSRGSGQVPWHSDTRVNYAGISRGNPRPYTQPAQPTRKKIFEGILFDGPDAKQKAFDVLDAAYNYISEFGSLSVACIYQLAGLPSEWTDEDYGWYTMRGADAKWTPDGYMIVMPPTEVLK